jgi:hypothetical protein
MIDPTTQRAEEIRESTGMAWERACLQAEAERDDVLEAASHTLDRMAARLEIVARAWREEADYMCNGDHALLGTLPGREGPYADSASRSLLRGLSAEVDAITRAVQAEIPAR